MAGGCACERKEAAKAMAQPVRCTPRSKVWHAPMGTCAPPPTPEVVVVDDDLETPPKKRRFGAGVLKARQARPIDLEEQIDALADQVHSSASLTDMHELHDKHNHSNTHPVTENHPPKPDHDAFWFEGGHERQADTLETVAPSRYGYEFK